ncbi:MAG TPA: EAL domain-containing protein [Solirubrobacteraceae bacterium]|jgi:diguanylate cyclase (GGDEF)-like protein/PAS domain S-box-containing protein|nr:EAL domain-containing protein [Solirubrobacteraceae bacterium]
MPATITACVAALTLLAAFLLYQQASSSTTQQQRADASRARSELRDVLDTTIGRVQDVAAAASEHWPSSEQFDGLADGLLQSQALDRISLVRYLTARERGNYERAHGEIYRMPQAPPPPPPPGGKPPAGAGLPPAILPAPPPSGRRRGIAGPLGALAPPRPALERAPPAASYFVLASEVQRSPGGAAIGTDIGSEQRRHIALLAAAASGQPQATAPIAPAGEPPAHPTVTAIFAPVYRARMPVATPVERLAALRGFVTTGYHYNLLDPLIAQRLPPGAAYLLRDGDVTIAAHEHPSQPSKTVILVAGRDWVLSVGAPARDLSPVLDAGIVGGTLTLLLCWISVQAYRRERFALNLVQTRGAEREIAQSALATAEERFRTAFAESPIGIALISPQGHHLQVNRALCRISGYEEQQLLALPAAKLTHPDDRRADELAIAFMLSGQLRVYDVEKRLLKSDGEIAWAAVHTTLVRHEHGAAAYLLTQIEDITARHHYEKRLQHMADHDPLTGLLNRRAYERTLTEHLDSRREGRDGAVIVLDLDDFKHVNDTLGHGAGDDLIARVAQALVQRLRSDDVIARLGGDEFAILVRNGGPEQIEHVAKLLLETVREQRAARGHGGPERPMTASIGIAPLDGRKSISAEEALTAADLAMYDAKESGRNRYETYGGDSGLARSEGTPPAKARIETRLEWVERIRAALDEDRLVLYAQPVVQTASGLMTQHELLIRMLDEDGSLIEPGAFLPIAERYGLIREIDRWVIERAIAMLGQQRDEGRAPVVEINLSGQSLSDPDLADHVGRALSAAEVDPRQLIFEVTETAAIGNMAAAKGCAERLGALGCRFALDDFGAGFGSFYYLKHLPFDFIKIDGEFVRSCTVDPTDRLVVGAVVDLAKGMGKLTVAEFVGDEQTLSVLRELGVDYVQGFHLGRPAPLSDWLAYAEGRHERPDEQPHRAEMAATPGE